MIIDADRHIQEPGDLWQRGLPDHLRARGPRMIARGGGLGILIGDHSVPPPAYRAAVIPRAEPVARFAPFARRRFSADAQIEAMDSEAIDVAILFPTLGLLVMGADDVDCEITTASARVYNDWLAEYCREASGRLFGVAMIDPRDVDGACAEARRAIDDLGFVAVFMRPNPVLSRRWSDPAYDPLWSTLEDLDVPVCWHEGSVSALPQVGPGRLGYRFPVWHVASHPMEQQLVLIDLVMEGVLERHPRLRCGFMECGATWLPYYLWRLDEHAALDLRGWRDEDELELPLRPSQYVLRQCWVSAESDETHLAHTLGVTHAANVMWASDFPHADATYPGAIAEFRTITGMTDAYADAVLCSNPLSFYGPRLKRAVLSR